MITWMFFFFFVVVGTVVMLKHQACEQTLERVWNMLATSNDEHTVLISCVVVFVILLSRVSFFALPLNLNTKKKKNGRRLKLFIVFCVRDSDGNFGDHFNFQVNREGVCSGCLR